jgi:hypothetical protein
MLDRTERYAFEKFPRGELTFKITRRQFWSAIVHNFLVFKDKGRGIPAYTLDNLGSWPDEQLARLLPAVVSGCEISVQDGLVWGKPRAARCAIELFPQDSPALIAFNLFNGLTPLREVSRRLVQTTGWGSAHSFAYTRGLFLTLVMAGICQPVP